jgi:FKBP-type peptidyl-prolyl cis-trans isomerase FkpA
MQKLSNYLMFLIVLSFLIINNSCKKENEPRTREMEMAELDVLLKEKEAKGIDIDTTNMSVFYFRIAEGEGPFPKAGDSCLVSYIGFLPSGKIFEDSRKIHPPDGVWRFKYKPPHKIAGLTNGIGYLNKGSEIEMFITSDNAFGSKGTTNVPPFTTLIYRAKMHDLISND